MEAMAFKAEQQLLPQMKSLKKGKKISPRLVDGRWTIIGVFFLTVVASLFFYLKTEAPFLWQKVVSPAVLSSLPGKFNAEPAIESFKTLTQDLRGTYGFYVYRFTDQVEYGLYQDLVFPAASLIKLPVMLAVYQEAEKGAFGLVQYQELVEAMGQRSDNGAFNQMIRVLGEEKIQATIDSLAMSSTSLARNDTTPADIGLFFRQLWEGGIVSEAHRDEILGFLTETEFEDRLPAGLPESVRVAHKIGTEIGSFSDGGIVFGSQPFVVVVISKNAREGEADQALPQIAQMIWEFENQ
jgi:beta-lactamase class A